MTHSTGEGVALSFEDPLDDEPLGVGEEMPGCDVDEARDSSDWKASSSVTSSPMYNAKKDDDDGLRSDGSGCIDNAARHGVSSTRTSPGILGHPF